MKNNNIKVGKNLTNNGAIIGYEPMRKIKNKKLSIAENCFLNSGAIIYLGSKIGNNFKTGHYVVIREEVKIGNNVSVWGHTTIDYGAIIGNNVKIHTNCYIAQYTKIENDVFLAPGVIIGNDPHPGCPISKDCLKKFAVKIKKGAQIGLNVTLLPGVIIGKNSLVGAGAVVTKNVPNNSVVVGNPARIIKKIGEIKCPINKIKKPYKDAC